MKNFEEAFKEFQKSIHNHIETFGWSVIGVAGEEGAFPFIYTVGMKTHNRPDLLMIGGCSGSYHRIINILASKTKDVQFKNEELVDITGKFPLKTINARNIVKSIYTIQAGQFYRTEEYEVQQILIPDQMGKYPDDPRCSGNWSTIPVFKKVYDA